ncbi:MAG: hypothetical protein KDF64_09120 [Geminicoccaceae bacterium]|nr:hypothetical protein [Geminicoccaceae bacterium]
MFVTNFASGSVSITQYNPNIYRLQILNSEGKTVEDMNIRADTPDIFNEIGQLFNLARRSTLKADETLDAIISALG